MITLLRDWHGPGVSGHGGSEEEAGSAADRQEAGKTAHCVGMRTSPAARPGVGRKRGDSWEGIPMEKPGQRTQGKRHGVQL